MKTCIPFIKICLFFFLSLLYYSIYDVFNIPMLIAMNVFLNDNNI